MSTPARSGPAKTINVQEAKTHLSALLARVAAGESIGFSRHGKPIAQLVPLDPAPRRQLGFLQGSVGEEFFDPCPTMNWRAGEHQRSANLSPSRPLFNSIINITRSNRVPFPSANRQSKIAPINQRENMRLERSYSFYFSVNLPDPGQPIKLSARLPGSKAEADEMVECFKQDVITTIRQVAQELDDKTSI